MRRLLLVLAFSLLVVLFVLFSVPALAQAPAKEVEVINDPLMVEVVNPAPPAPPAHWQLVGFTAATFTGDAGLFAFSRACHAEFPGSRMCVSPEILRTSAIPAVLVGEAWVQPSPAAGSTSGIVDASGARSVGSNLTCGDFPTWSHASLRGLTVDFEGRFRAGLCDAPRPIACCAVVP
jgi:hypothetical protein